MSPLLFFSVFTILFNLGSLETQCPEFVSCEASEKPETCPKGTFYRDNVKVHGCCSGCLRLKGETEFCNFPAECEPGLTCDSTKKCTADAVQACEYYKRKDSLYEKFKYWTPVCLPDGTFAPKQCKGEKMAGKCFCVNEKGKRIFGEEEWSKAENMTCGCSRLAEKMKGINPDGTLHCDRLGNFEPLQCDQKVCWCANPKTGIPYTIVVPMEMIASLPCYNRNEVGVQYYRQCESANYMLEVIKSLLWNHGTKDFSSAAGNCNFDGSYHRVQNFKEKTRCVYTNNSPLTEAVESNETNCNCAYDRHVSKLNQVEFVLDCLPYGNYRTRQVWNGNIYCVDEDGFHYSDNPRDYPSF